MFTNDSNNNNNNNNLNLSPFGFGFGGFGSDFKPSTIIAEGFDIQGTHWGMHNNDMNNLHMAFIIYRDNLDSLRNFYKLPKEPYILENIYLKKLKPRIFSSKEAQKELRGLTLKEQTEYIRTTLVLVKGVNEAFKYIEAEDKKFSIALNWLYRENKITCDPHTGKYSHAQREPGSIRVREFSETTARNLAIELEDFMNRNNITEERIIDIQYSVSMTSNRNGTSERHFAIIIFR